jgi:hypothetical protein
MRPDVATDTATAEQASGKRYCLVLLLEHGPAPWMKKLAMKRFKSRE